MKKLIAFLLFTVIFIVPSISETQNIPVTGVKIEDYQRPFDAVAGIQLNDELSDIDPALSRFVESVTDGYSQAVRGVYVDDVLALNVIQQPSNSAGYVSETVGVATQFGMAKQYNSIGLLAHNYSSGAKFFDLTFGSIIQIVYGDGSISQYEVAEIYRYQALSPKSSTSQFVNLETGDRYSAAQVFYQMYTGDHHVTLQTCIQEGSVDSWGRLFIIAYPL